MNLADLTDHFRGLGLLLGQIFCLLDAQDDHFCHDFGRFGHRGAASRGATSGQAVDTLGFQKGLKLKKNE